MVEVKDISWLAGLLEGEGCFSFNKSIQLRLIMTDRDVVEHAARLLKSEVRLSKLRPNRKQAYYTALCSGKAAAWMMTLYPFMGERRRNKIEGLLSLWKVQKIYTKRKGKI